MDKWAVYRQVRVPIRKFRVRAITPPSEPLVRGIVYMDMDIEWNIGSMAGASKARRLESDQFAGRVFSRYHEEFAFCRRMRRHPRHSDALIRTIKDEDGRIVAQLYIIDRELCIGSSTLRMGGIASVGTDSAFRKRGLATMLMNDTMAFMAQEGFDVSILFSIPEDYYNRFGYMTVLPEYTTTIEGLARLQKLQSFPSVPGSRALRRSDMSLLPPFYGNAYRDTPGITRRDTAHWNWLRRAPDFDGVVVTDGDKLSGYALTRIKGHQLVVHEAGVHPSPRIHDALLRTLARKALSSGLTSIRLDLPSDLPLSRLCVLEHEGVQSVKVPYKKGGMAKIINLASTLRKMKPVFHERLQKSAYKDLQQRIVIDTDIGGVALKLNRGQVTVETLPGDHLEDPDVAIPQAALTGLLFGLFYPLHIWEVWGRPLEPEMVNILTALFPKRFPQIPWMDHF